MAGRQKTELDIEIIGDHDFSQNPLELRCSAINPNHRQDKRPEKCKQLLGKLTSGSHVDIEIACPRCRGLNRFRILT